MGCCNEDVTYVQIAKRQNYCEEYFAFGAEEISEDKKTMLEVIGNRTNTTKCNGDEDRKTVKKEIG